MNRKAEAASDHGDEAALRKPVHDKDYRENFARSLFLTGKITQEAAHALSPRIKELRAASGDPITLHRQPWGIICGSGGHPFSD